MMTRFKQIEDLFKEINAVLHTKVNIYTIGGAVLLEQGLKTTTKDIDLVVWSKDEFNEFQAALEKMGFRSQIPGKDYAHMNLNQVFIKGDFRIDLFEKEVCGKFPLSEGMKERAIKVIDLKHFAAYLCSNEDVFMFKTITERDGDLEDCESIALAGVDWSVILQEIKAQIQHSKQDVWITWIGERLDLLEERGLEMPIMNEINKLREKFFDGLEKKP